MSGRKSERGKERDERGLLIGGLIVAGLILFFFIFHIDGYNVTGNYHATDREIIEYVMQGPFSYNTVFLAMSFNDREVDDPFIETISVDMKSARTIEVRVTEKKLIGSVCYNGSYWYFDTKGIVRTRSDFSEADYRAHMAGKSFSEIRNAAASEAGGAESRVPASGGESAALPSGAAGSTEKPSGAASGAAGSASDPAGTSAAAPGLPAAAPGFPEALPGFAAASESASGSAASGVRYLSANGSGSSAAGKEKKTGDTAAADSASGTLRKGNGNYIPVVTGLSFPAVSVGQPLTVLFTNVFPGLRELKKYVDEGGYEPDGVEYSLDGEMLLTFGGITVNIGSFTEIEEELYVMNNILPSLEGQSGILHMENYDGSANRLIFSKNENNS